MNRFAAGLSEHPVPAHAVGEVAGEVIEALGGEDPDLLVCFASPHFVGALDDVVFALGNLLTPRVAIGASAVAVIGGPHEVEHGPALSVFAASLPDAELTPVSLSVGRGPDGWSIDGLPEPGEGPATLLLLADPFTFPLDQFLRRLEELAPEIQVVGGAASAALVRAATDCCSTAWCTTRARSACSCGARPCARSCRRGAGRSARR